MATLLEQIKNLEKLNEKAITTQLFVAVRKAEKEFIRLNQEQLSDGENVFGDKVGFYAPSTQGFADRDRISTKKREGDTYNFKWSGDFFEGFALGINGDEATITSNVRGDDDKLNFLTTNNLFGLNNENLAKVIKDEILPFINNFARTTLKI